jgi:membrane protease subunit HflK
MPWNDNSGGGGQGPWGSGGGDNKQNPWGQRPNNGGGNGGGGQQPPDLEDLLRQLGQRFGFGGGGDSGEGSGGGAGGIAGLGLIGVVLIGAWLVLGQAVYFIQEGERGVVLRFGEYVDTTDPGMNFKLPAPIETFIRTDVQQIRTEEIGATDDESLMLTGDENIVDIDFTVQWVVDTSYPEGVRDFNFNVRDQSGTVKAVAESAMREVVGTTDLQPIITTGRSEIARRAEEITQATLDDYRAGIRVDIEITYSDPPAGEVVEAFREVDSARQEREQLIAIARRYAREQIPQARADANEALEVARGNAQSVVETAQGEADEFNLIYDQYVQSPEVTRRRMLLETMEEVLPNSELIILDGDGGAVPYLPLGELGQNRARTGGDQ